MSYAFSNHIEIASSLRNFFDSYVLNLNYDANNSNKAQHLDEEALLIFNKDPVTATTQMNNTGRDFPPGVREWYEFSKPYSNIEAVFECQKQNSWWNRQLSKRRICFHSIIFLLVLISFLIIAFCHNQGNIWNVLMCASGLVLRGIDSVRAQMSYNSISRSIDAVIDNLCSGYQQNNLVELQAMIDKRRTIPVLESNSIHRKLATALSSMYERITRHI